jgi:hypothetical protein
MVPKQPTWTQRLGQKAIEFVSAPASPRPLAAFRIGLTAVLVLQAITVAPGLVELYGKRGVVQWAATEPAIPDYVPHVRWLADALGRFGVTDVACLQAVFLTYVAALGCLLIGWRSRIAAVVAWLTHLALNSSGDASIYGVDQFAHVGLFFCVWMPVAGMWSVDQHVGRASSAPTPWARLSLRVLQLYLCIVYLSSGIEKALGEQWWNGEAIWRSVMRPDLGRFDATWMAQVPWLAMLAGWGTLLIEIGYPIFVWPRWTRRPWALLTISLHLGIAVFLGLVSFAALMIVYTSSAFLVSGEPSSETGEKDRKRNAEAKSRPEPVKL